MNTNTSPTAQSQMSANDQINSNYFNDDSLELEPIKGTPLYLHGSPLKGYCVVMKDSFLTQPFKTKEELLKWVKSKPWELLITVMTFVCDHYHILKSKREHDNQKTKEETSNVVENTFEGSN